MFVLQISKNHGRSEWRRPRARGDQAKQGPGRELASSAVLHTYTPPVSVRNMAADLRGQTDDRDFV